MAEIFFLGDMHLGHKKMRELRFPDNPDKANEIIIDRWNSKVGKKDTVILPGDIAFNSSSIHLLNELNGYKRGVLGNHDELPLDLYSQYFNSLHGALELNKFIITHIPIHPLCMGRYKGNIHGHLHSESIKDDLYICVSGEHINFTPISFDEILQIVEERKRCSS